MVDFLMVSHRTAKGGQIEVYPTFIVKKSKDLMIRGGDFYAIWMEDRGMWSTDEQDALQLIDQALDDYAQAKKEELGNCKVLHMWDSRTRMIGDWHRYCQSDMRDNFHMLDERLIFANTETTKTDYASKRLQYPLEEGDFSAWDKLVSTLYSPEERQKIEWAIGSIVDGSSRTLQKFMVLYGAAGTGKSTILNIIQQLFDGYYSVFDAKALGSSNNSFALEAFKTNPLVAIQHDGDLSRIEDNTRLNSLVSHEIMTVNEKFKSTYSSRFQCFLFMGTNKPVKITDAKSGLIRRLIDVTPSGHTLNVREYTATIKKIRFELGAIAYHCREVYQKDPDMYDNYIPLNMIGATNDFYNFVADSYTSFAQEENVTLRTAWEMYKNYCDYAKVSFPYPMKSFKEELKNYFADYREREVLADGTKVKGYYIRFLKDKFDSYYTESTDETEPQYVIEFEAQPSVFDRECATCIAQYAATGGKEIPAMKWSEVTTSLEELDTSKLHYVRVPVNHIVVDFDLKDKEGNKCFQKNLEAASKWPPTYAEVSKSGQGIHLHYIYTGDPTKLSRVYDDDIEIKVFTGNSSLRRLLTLCNALPIASISSGLPLKGEKMLNFDGIKNERHLRASIKQNLRKEVHPGTKPSIDFIYTILEQAYASGMKYDVTDLRNTVLTFAANSTNHAEYCVKKVGQMKFKSEEDLDGVENEDEPLVFYDIEVFPNLLLVNYKVQGEEKPVIRMINPTSQELEHLTRYKLVGFNCRRYDNHIIYARWIEHYNNAQIFDQSQRIIVSKDRSAFFGNAYNLSYTDVYDFSSKKQNLKKWEIELGIHHKELGLPWDQPVPEERWLEVAEYCDNDVLATEAVFNARQADFTARKILAEVASMTVNDTTNTLTTRIIFGGNREPQDQFNYRFMGDTTQIDWNVTRRIIMETFGTLEGFDEFTAFDSKSRPIFPGYKYEFGKSTYRNEESFTEDEIDKVAAKKGTPKNQRDEVGEGGYVYSEPGMYTDVALLDISSMHPSSIINEQLFGEVYTKRFQDIRDARIAIKHGDFESAKKMLDGKLAKYLDDPAMADDLAGALKIAINSVYGLTKAGFKNAFRDPRNEDNIVAKRGALFMINLKYEVQKRGFTVAHIKTDSIKIPNATPEIIDFVKGYGALYGYSFEHEATYDRMCLVNKAVYIAKYATVEKCENLYGAEYVHSAKDVVKDCKKHGGDWTATGKQFQVGYVFKKLFSHEPIEFEDMCETMSVTSALYLDMNEGLADVEPYEKELASLKKRLAKLKSVDEYSEEEADSIEVRIDELNDAIPNGHDYRFVGRVGQFCPIKPNYGGGVLLREVIDKETGVRSFAAATGSKGHRWLESETVRGMDTTVIDRSYYDNQVDAAVADISAFGDFEWFVGD